MNVCNEASLRITAVIYASARLHSSCLSISRTSFASPTGYNTFIIALVCFPINLAVDKLDRYL